MKQLIKFDNTIINLDLVLLYEFFSNNIISFTFTTGEKKEFEFNDEQYKNVVAYLNKYWQDLDLNK